MKMNEYNEKNRKSLTLLIIIRFTNIYYHIIIVPINVEEIKNYDILFMKWTVISNHFKARLNKNRSSDCQGPATMLIQIMLFNPSYCLGGAQVDHPGHSRQLKYLLCLV